MFRGENWSEVRKNALKRDLDKCRRCQNPALGVHHIIPYSKTRDNSEVNLITLCSKHHREEENKYIKYGIAGWMKHQVSRNKNMLKYRRDKQ